MTKQSDEYAKQAAECERMAKNSVSDVDRSTWLRLAQEWMRLLRASHGNETVQVDQKDWPAADESGSKSSH
jgi:hypothetical protein